MAWVLRRHDELKRRGRQRAAYALFLASRLDRRRLMLRAWTLVRTGAPGPARALIGPALAQSWQERRQRLAVLG